jgi:hypothetical protein
VASSPLAAEPLNDLQVRLATLRNDQPVRLEVEVEMEHKGTAPLHLNDERMKGTVIVSTGRHGLKVRTKRSSGRLTHFSVWRDDDGARDAEIPLLEESEARFLLDPAEAIGLALRDSVLVSDEMSVWQDQPARVLVLRAAEIEAAQEDGRLPARVPFLVEGRIWLNENGTPLAMEGTLNLGLGAALTVTQHQTVTFQEVEGRLLVAEVKETYSGTALSVLRGEDKKKIRVRAVQ